MGMAVAPVIRLADGLARTLAAACRRDEGGGRWGFRHEHPVTCCTKVPMTGFLESAGIYAVIVFGVLEAMCIPISSELTFLLGGALAGGALGVGHAHPSLLLVIV